MKLKYKIFEIAAIALTCFCFTKSNPIKENISISSNNTSKLKLQSKSNLLSLLSVITSVESNGKKPKDTIKDHSGNRHNLADVLATNQKLSQNFKINTNLNDTAKITPILADVTNIITNIAVDVRDGFLLRSNYSELISSTNGSSSPTSTGRSSRAESVKSSALDNPTITISTKKPVSLSPAEIQQIIDIGNNRRQLAGDDSSAAETAMKMMVNNQLGAEDAMKMMTANNFDQVNGEDQLDAALQLARNGAENEMASNKLGNDAVQEKAIDAAVNLMAENNLGNNAEMQMMANKAARIIAQNNYGPDNANGVDGTNKFRVDDTDIKLMQETMDKLGQEELLKLMARTLPTLAPVTEALSIYFDDSDALHTLNDSISPSGDIWRTYETAESLTRRGRRCFQCQPEIRTSYRDPRIPWICGAYNLARRSFKSICMMHMRNCQDGTMFVKIHDNKCAPDGPDEPIPHGKTFFYDYQAPISFESAQDVYDDSIETAVSDLKFKALYEDFKFVGRKDRKKGKL